LVSNRKLIVVAGTSFGDW